MEQADGRYRVPAVVRTVAILTQLAARQDQTLSELVADVGLPRTTVFHLLTTMEDLGLVRRAPNGRGYRLGMKLFELGSGALRQIDVRELARPHLRRLVELHGETAQLSTMDADERELVCIEKVDSPQPVRVGLWVGAKVPLHATAAGKVVLARMSQRRLAAYLDRAPLERYTETTICDPARLRAELARARIDGYAGDNEEYHPGVSGLAAPALDAMGHVVATVSVTAPSRRLTARLRRRVARSVKAEADALSRELGASPEQLAG
jgi:DNA-binding IclR family transcriptional regulator